MRKIFLIVALALAIAPVAAYAGSSNTGCGLGSLAWQGKADTTLFQAFESTTNGTFASQTFGITFGTSNCSQPGRFAKSERLNEFVRANMDGLAKDIAAGRGESLSTLAELMAVPQAERTAFNKTLQSNFGKIFPSADVEMAHVVDTIVSVTAG